MKPTVNNAWLRYSSTGGENTLKGVTTQVKPKCLIFPFTIQLGNIASTASGYKQYNIEPNDFPSYQNVFSGSEQIVVGWDGSEIATDIPSPEQNWFHRDNLRATNIKHRVGNYFEGTIANKTVSVEFKQNDQNSSLLNQVQIRRYTLVVDKFQKNCQMQSETKGTDPNDPYPMEKMDQLTLTEYDFFKLYLVATDNENDYSWLYMSSVEFVYNEDNSVNHYILTLESLSDRMAKEGLSIDEYVQVMGAGVPYAFPRVHFEKDKPPHVDTDKTKLNKTGARYAQVEFFGPIALNSIMFFGRPFKTEKDASGKVTDTIYMSPRPIFFSEFIKGVPDPLSNKSTPNDTFSCFYACQPVLEKWYEGLSADFSSRYNFLSRGQEEGVLSYKVIDYTGLKYVGDGKVYNSNLTVTTPGHERPAHDFLSIDDVDYEIATQKAEYNDNYLDLTQGNNFVNPGKGALKNRKLEVNDRTWKPYDFMAFWALTNKIFEVAPYQYQRTTIISGQQVLSNLGLGFLNRLTFGFPWGWTTTNMSTIGTFIPMPCFIDSSLSYYLASTFLNANNQDGKGFLPLFAFNDSESSDSIAQMVSANATSTMLCGKLSTFISADTYSIKTGAKLNRGINHNTLYLGQTMKDNDTFVTYDWDSFRVMNDNSRFDGYMIDDCIISGYGKVSFKITLYDDLPSFKVKDDYHAGSIDNSIYQGTFETRSKYNQNIRNILTAVKLGRIRKDYSGKPHPWPEPYPTPIPVEPDYWAFPDIGTNNKFTWDREEMENIFLKKWADAPNQNYQLAQMYNPSVYTWDVSLDNNNNTLNIPSGGVVISDYTTMIIQYIVSAGASTARVQNKRHYDTSGQMKGFSSNILTAVYKRDFRRRWRYYSGDSFILHEDPIRVGSLEGRTCNAFFINNVLIEYRDGSSTPTPYQLETGINNIYTGDYQGKPPFVPVVDPADNRALSITYNPNSIGLRGGRVRMGTNYRDVHHCGNDAPTVAYWDLDAVYNDVEIAITAIILKK